MTESIVQKKLGKLIQKEISAHLSGQHDVPGVMLTVSVVRVTGDLGLAKIYVSCFPDAQLDSAVEALNANSWEIRKWLASRIKNKVRKIPELRFYGDDTYQKAEQIEQLLNEILPKDEV